MPEQKDPINPTYYQDLGDKSPVHIIQHWGLGFCLGNALKYIARAGKKNSETRDEDLKKAIWYIQWEIDSGVAEHVR